MLSLRIRRWKQPERYLCVCAAVAMQVSCGCCHMTRQTVVIPRSWSSSLSDLLFGRCAITQWNSPASIDALHVITSSNFTTAACVPFVRRGVDLCTRPRYACCACFEPIHNFVFEVVLSATGDRRVTACYKPPLRTVVTDRHIAEGVASVQRGLVCLFGLRK